MPEQMRLRHREGECIVQNAFEILVLEILFVDIICAKE